MLASLVIDHLRAAFRTVDAGILYLYCDYRAQDEQLHSYLIANLLKQSLQQQPSITDEIQKTCQDHMQAGTRPSDSEIVELLQSSIQSFSRTFVIVDALDELSGHGLCRQNLLGRLLRLQATTEINLLTTSRHIPALTLDFNEHTCLDVRASTADIEIYVRGRIAELPTCVKSNVSLQNTIVTEIGAAVKGMYAYN